MHGSLGVGKTAWIGTRVREVLLGDWFTHQCIKYCGKDYGSLRVNQYRFYRTVYRMTAERALREVRRFHNSFSPYSESEAQPDDLG